MCESPTALPQEYPDIPSAEGHAVTCPGWRSPPCQQLLWTRFTLSHQDSALTDLTGRARESVGRDDEWLEWSRCFNCLVRQEIMRLKTGFSTAHVWLHERFSNSRSDADQNLGLFLHFCVFFRLIHEHRVYFYQLFGELLWKKSSQWWMTADWSLRRSFPSHLWPTAVETSCLVFHY